MEETDKDSICARNLQFCRFSRVGNEDTLLFGKFLRGRRGRRTNREGSGEKGEAGKFDYGDHNGMFDSDRGCNLPYLLSNLLKPFVPGRFARTVIEGIVRIVLFISYILLISKMKDIQRVFMYHGAEHKCINCIEHGMDLTVENVRKSSKQHKRCGTSFLFFVLFVSIIVCFFITTESPVLRVLLRIALLPVIAGISYEIIRLAGNTEHPVVELLSKPGLALQNLTTKEPDDDMIEVAICSVEAVFDWKKYQKENFPEEP